MRRLFLAAIAILICQTPAFADTPCKDYGFEGSRFTVCKLDSQKRIFGCIGLTAKAKRYAILLIWNAPSAADRRKFFLA